MFILDDNCMDLVFVRLLLFPMMELQKSNSSKCYERTLFQRTHPITQSVMYESCSSVTEGSADR